VLWDLPGGIGDVAGVEVLAAKHGVRPGSINPNTFQDQVYKHGSLGNPDPAIRKKALQHILDSIEIGSQLGSPRCFRYGSPMGRTIDSEYSSAAAMVRRSTPERPPTPD